MKMIYKYVLCTSRLRPQMPKGAKILTAREQGSDICVWAEVDPEQPMQERIFEVYGTGHPMPEHMGQSREYIGTAHLEGGALVFHVYEYTGI